MLPFGQVYRRFGFGNELVVATTLDFAEEHVVFRHRTQRIQSYTGGWSWGCSFNTIDVDLDSAVVVSFFVVSQYFFAMGHVSSPESSVGGTLNMKCACPSLFGQRSAFLFFLPFAAPERPNGSIPEHYEVEGLLEGQMIEKARPLGSVEMVASPDEVREAIASLTDAESVKLQRLAEGAAFRLRRHVWGKDAKDILHEAIRRVLENKRHWKTQKVDFIGFLAGVIASIESDWRQRGKRGETPVLETDLPASNADGDPMPNAVQRAVDGRPNPEEQLIESEELTQEELFQQMEDLFREDSLASLIFSEWRRQTKGPEIMKALDLTRKGYDAAVRRMDRAIQKRWPEGMPHVR